MEKVVTVKKLQEYDEAYDIGSPLIDDVEYDRLKELAKAKYSDHSYFKTVGASTSAEQRGIKLPYVMGSLDKVNVDNILKWTQGKGYLTASEKIDGISILCKWEKGYPVSLMLRGNGETGQDISEKARCFIPSINTDDTVWLRGEAVLTGDDYKTYGFANNRNGSAGILNRKEIDGSLNSLIPYFYEIVDAPHIPKEEYERFLFIKSLGLQTPDFALITVQDMPNLINILIDFLAQSKKYKPYDIDGIVLAKNVSTRENILFPSDKVAFKIKGEEVIVTVNGITWQPSRLGKLKPVINIEPMQIGGVTVSNVTGFHAGYISENNIGKNTKLSMVRAGDVIPHITGVIEATKAKLPTVCPSCEGRLKLVNDDLMCQSINCSDSGVKRAMYFLKTIGVKGYSEASLEKLGIEDIGDIVNFDKIRRFCRYNRYSKYERVLIHILKNVDASKVLAGFGIPGIGLKVATEICDALDINGNSDFERLFGTSTKIDVGEKTTKSFKENVCNYRDFFYKLITHGRMDINPRGVSVEGKLTNKNFVITGTHSISRKTMVAYIEQNGGTVSNSVKSSTTMLISARYELDTTKYKKAMSLNVPIGDWYEFKGKYGL